MAYRNAVNPYSLRPHTIHPDENMWNHHIVEEYRSIRTNPFQKQQNHDDASHVSTNQEQLLAALWTITEQYLTVTMV
jgi:hypothetical protein